MKKLDNSGAAADLDGLLLKLKARHDAREQAGGIFPSDEMFKQRFFQAARAQERPRVPMIWKIAACVAVCLLSFQIVLTQFRDDSSTARVDGVAVAEGGDRMVTSEAFVSDGKDAEAEMLTLSMAADDFNSESASAAGENMILTSAFAMTEAADVSRSSPGAPKSQYGTPSSGMFGWLSA